LKIKVFQTISRWHESLGDFEKKFKIIEMMKKKNEVH
jgi:predicted DNA-binding protein YlxM (UPF0122 family)